MGPVELSVEMETNNRRDLDNALKPICDLLVDHGVIESDRMSTVRRIEIKCSDEVEGVRVTIRNTNA